MKHAVVVGAGIAGLLAARALVGVYDRVTVFERDELPAGPTSVEDSEARRGVPQGRHAHLLLARGLIAMEELLPGLTESLRQEGVLAADLQQDMRWTGNGSTVRRDSSGLRTMLVSRPGLEAGLRRRLAALGGVDVLDRHETVGLLRASGTRVVKGVSVRAVGEDRPPRGVTADLVVDATGRASRGPTWLAQAGLAVPPAERSPIDLRYTTLRFEATTDRLSGDLGVVATATGTVARGMVALAQGGNEWVVTLQGRGEDAPPTGRQGFLDFVSSLGVADVRDALAGLRPVGEAVPGRYPDVTSHHYHSLEEHPYGFLALGDAFAGLDPAHGQGMTSAAVQALLLRECLLKGEECVESSYAGLAAELTGTLRAGGTASYAPVGADERWRTRVSQRDWYMGLVYEAAAKDTEVARTLIRLAHLLEPPGVLLRDDFRQRILALTTEAR
ncbi:NAD(P)/FAD-dependent oxidoreductase [Streptomyces sp. NPDC102406]|uniref:NAD(P)/FAD-dependent oxidoreductase n=1 Tax=Streptomyces sp. NPDC102406 TaxID=3366171 RepID=UPI0037F3653D